MRPPRPCAVHQGSWQLSCVATFCVFICEHVTCVQFCDARSAQGWQAFLFTGNPKTILTVFHWILYSCGILCFKYAPPKGGRVGPLFKVASSSFVSAMGYWCPGCSGILRGTTILASISSGFRPGQFGTIHPGLPTLKCVVLHFWILAICSCFVGLVTEFIWTAVISEIGWMNTDSQCETPERETFMSLIGESTAGTLDGDLSFDMPNGAFPQPLFATDSPEQSFQADFFGEPGAIDLEGCDTSQSVQGDASAMSSDVAVSRSDYNRALFDARMAAMGDVELKMPWESGVMKQIFDSDDESIFPRVVPPLPPACLLPVSATSADAVEQAAGEMPSAKSLVRSDIDLPFYSFAIRVVPDRDMFAEDALLWEKAIQKWIQVFEILGFPGMLGHAILSEQVDGLSSLQSEALRDALGVKSPRTAIKRAQTLKRYFSWLQSTFTDWDPWNRARCLQYLGQVGSQSVPASKGITLLEALRFGRYVMQLPIPEALLADPQLRGRAQRLMIAKDMYHPARPLKAAELASMEKAMSSDLDVRDKYLLGGVIFAILSRSRWSDLRYVDQFWIERAVYNGELFGFVEARTKFHKTATSLAKKQRYMPLVAPLIGVTDTDWSKHWCQAMQELGIDLNTEPFGAVCRAPAHDGNLCARSCTSEEIGAFINRFLKTDAENSVSSHSFKHTTLVWCSAYGLDEPSRTLLGHHELQGAKSMMVYSRDMLTRPLQLYCSMLSNIRRDHFRPDESRTSRMLDLMKLAEKQGDTQGAPAETAKPQVFEPEVQAGIDDGYEPSTPLETEHVSPGPTPGDSDESDSIHSTEGSSSDSSDDGGQAVSHVDIPGPVWRNKRSHVVHKCSNLSRQTACGRLVVAANFELLEQGCSSLNARCSRCFRGEVITNVGGLVEALDRQKAKRSRNAWESSCVREEKGQPILHLNCHAISKAVQRQSGFSLEAVCFLQWVVLLWFCDSIDILMSCWYIYLTKASKCGHCIARAYEHLSKGFWLKAVYCLCPCWTQQGMVIRTWVESNCMYPAWRQTQRLSWEGCCFVRISDVITPQSLDLTWESSQRISRYKTWVCWKIFKQKPLIPDQSDLVLWMFASKTA